MFVIFFSIILILNISSSRPTENKNAPFRFKLRRSLTHLRAMLFTIEDKIKTEKKKLSQIVYNMNRKKNVDAARTDTMVKPYFEAIIPNDYNTDAQEITPPNPAASFTFPTMFPSPPPNSYWPPTAMTDTSVTTNFTVFAETTKVTTTTQSLFMQDIKKTMKEDKHNYFTAFLTRFTELIAIKKTHDILPVLNKLLAKLTEKLDTVPFDEEEGKRLTKVLKMYFPMVSAMPPDKLKEQAMYAHFTLKNKATMMSPEDNKMTDFYGHYFNKEDGEELFKALEKFYEYNNGKHTAAEVVDMIVQAALKPYLRVKETGVDTTASTVSEIVESAVHETQYPEQVTNYPIPITQHPITVTQYPVTAIQYPVTATQYPVTVTQYPVTATQYPVTAIQYPVTVTHYPNTAIKYPITATQYPVTATQYAVTATQYQVPSWRRNMNLMQNVKRNLYPKLLKKIKEHYKIDNNESHHRLSPKRKFDQEYLKNRDGQMDEQNQTKQNVYISSEKVYNYPKYYKDIAKNYMFHKIREVPSYDEEEHLRTNLYDALRHGNMTFVSFRKSGGDVIGNQPLRDLSSEPDEEWVLKNNIYKFFG